MSINIKKYTKEQMAKMVEDAQAEVQKLRRVNAALTVQISQMNGEAITRENVIAKLKAAADGLRNKLADTEAALGRANAELTYSVTEKNALRNDVTKMTDRAAFELGRANYAESHPWRNLWAWVKRKLSRE
jgi:chromosome segregation ATPase